MLGSQRLEVTFAKGDSLDLRHAARRTKPNCPTRGGSTSLYGEPDPSADDTGRTLVVEASLSLSSSRLVQLVRLTPSTFFISQNFPRRITAAQLKSHLYGSVSAQCVLDLSFFSSNLVGKLIVDAPRLSLFFVRTFRRVKFMEVNRKSQAILIFAVSFLFLSFDRRETQSHPFLLPLLFDEQTRPAAELVQSLDGQPDVFQRP